MYFITSVLFFLVVLITAEKCKTPDNKEGECISLYLCSTLLDKLKTEEDAAIVFIRKSSCGCKGSDPLVCCGTLQPNPINNTNKLKLLPDRRYCGYQHADDYIRNDTSIAISEYPWLALLLYDTHDGGLETLCGGSLINNRYVLTAAHCLLPVGIELKAVRLGEYNIRNNTDCTDDADIRECSDPPEDIGIETTIPHLEFNLQKRDNDIGLIRLNKTIQYTDYIRPICLPLPGTVFAKPNDIVFSTGLGLSQLGGVPVFLKKKVSKKIITNNECISLDSYLEGKLNDRQFCTVEIANTTDYSCLGDSGAPVIFSHRNQWHQEGIVSYSYKCGIGVPEIQVKVVSYLNWIINNIVP